MITTNLDCASLVSVRIRDLKREVSCLLDAESVSGLDTRLLVRLCSISGLVADMAWERH